MRSCSDCPHIDCTNWYNVRAIPFSKVHWGGTWIFTGGYLPPHFNFVDSPYLLILNSILHLEPPCATSSSNILNYLIPPTPALRIIFRSHPRVIFENGIALIWYRCNPSAWRHYHKLGHLFSFLLTMKDRWHVQTIFAVRMPPPFWN